MEGGGYRGIRERTLTPRPRGQNVLRSFEGIGEKRVNGL